MKQFILLILLTLSFPTFAVSSNKVVFCEILEIGEYGEVLLGSGNIIINTNSDVVARINSNRYIRIMVRDRASSNRVNIAVLLGNKEAVETGSIKNKTLIRSSVTNVDLPFTTTIFANRKEYEMNCKR